MMMEPQVRRGGNRTRSIAVLQTAPQPRRSRVRPVADKMAVLRRASRELAPPPRRYKRVRLAAYATLKNEWASPSRAGKLSRAYLLKTRGLCRNCGGRGSGPGEAEWAGGG